MSSAPAIAAAASSFPATLLDHPTGVAAVAAAYRRDGLVRLTGVLDPRELAALDQNTAALIADGPAHRTDPDYFFARDQSGEVFHRIQYIFPKGPALLTAMANPRLLALCCALLGDDLVCAGEALVFKLPGNGREVPVHTDCDQGDPALHPSHQFFNLDLYLDRADVDNGCLLAAPGSQRSGETLASIAAQGYAYPGLIPVPAEPGDVLVHDCRLVHGSHRSTANRLRRTLYYEFHARTDLERDGYPPGKPVPAGWIANRQRILHRAIAERALTPWGIGEAPFVSRAATAAPSPGQPVDLRPRLGYSQYT